MTNLMHPANESIHRAMDALGIPPIEYPDAMSDVVVDWIDSRVNCTFVYWPGGRIMRYSDSYGAAYSFDKVS